MSDVRVLMIGAGRDVRGGVSSVVNSYYEAGLDTMCELTYLPTMEDGSKLRKMFVAAGARLSFERLVRRCDILHVHMSSDNSFYRKAMFIRKAYKEKRKIIIHMHGSTFDLFYKERCNDRQKQEVRDIFAMADAVIALSEDWKAFLAGHICKEEKIQVLYNAVPLPEAFEKDYHSREILFLGRLGQRKGAYDLIEALPELLRQYPDAHVYFGGDGERDRAEGLCRERGIADRVTFVGWVRGAEKERLLKTCSIYALPTYHEGMPMSVLEAMSYGMAVISTYTGGIPHIITDGKNGLLCQAGDRVALKELLAQALSSHERRKELGMEARAVIAERFDVHGNLEKLTALYDRLRA